MTDTAWERLIDFGGWGVFALVVIIAGRFVGRFFERALVGFEAALEINRRALQSLSEAVERFAAFELEENSTHEKIIESQNAILDELRSMRDARRPL